MKNWAKIDNNNVVQEVLVFEDGVTPSVSLPEGWQLICDDDNVKNSPGIGYTYNSEYSGFVVPKPFESWAFDAENCSWLPPTPCPNDGNEYLWNEETLTWDIDNS
jgi:hypothetical protein